MSFAVVILRRLASGRRASRAARRTIVFGLGSAALLVLATLVATADMAHALPAPGGARSARWTPPLALTRRVTTAIAQRWNVAPERLRLEWDSMPPAALASAVASMSDASPMQLLGTGDGGAWIVLATPTPQSAPVQLRVRAGTEQTRVTAARDLPRDLTLTSSDIITATAIEWGMPRTTMSMPATGWVTRRVHLAGETLREPAVGPPQLIRAGEPVTIVWRDGALELRLVGTAANTAALGERVAVRIDGRRRLEGTATGPGTARLQ
jgi:flagella basal body P-ring formation protein FlgA